MAEDLARVADFAEKLRVYFATLSSAVAFFVFGMAFTGYWLLVYALFAVLKSHSVFLWGAACSAILAAACTVIMFKSLPRSALAGAMRHGGRWIVAFLPPFVVLYAIPYPIVELYTVMWYPSLGLALLLVHLLIERSATSKGVLLARSFLVASILILATLPLVIYLVIARMIETAWITALGLMLISYFVAGIHALRRASKIFG